ncbi:MAG: ADOP family duplicated permease [Acidobacteriota bacterium]
MQRTVFERLLLLLYPKRIRRTQGDEILLWWRDRRRDRRPNAYRVPAFFAMLADAFKTRLGEGAIEPTLYEANAHLTLRQRVALALDRTSSDLRFAARGSRRRPGGFLLGVITLGVAVAALTVGLGVVRRVLLEPLPYPSSEQLVHVGKLPGDPSNRDQIYALSAPDFYDLRDSVTLLSGVAASRGSLFTVQSNASDDTQTVPEALFGAYVSANFFEILQVPPALGRSFSAAEDAEGLPRVVLSHEAWQRFFAGESSVVGSSVSIDREPWTVVGVMPADFVPPEGLYQQGAQLWVPFGTIPRDVQEDRQNAFLAVIGRLSESGSESAREELASIGRNLSTAYPEVGERLFGFVSLYRRTVGNFRSTLWMLLGAVSVLFLVAGVNTSGLLLASSIDRRKEFAVRRSIGAQRSHILSLLLNETLLLGSLAGVLGAALAAAWLRTLGTSIPFEIPRLEEFSLQASDLQLALGLGVLAGLLFGLLPALAASRLASWSDSDRGPRQADRGALGSRGVGGSRRDERTRTALVIAETCLAVTLVTGAALLLTSYQRLQRVDMGFSADSVEAIVLSPPAGTADEQRAFFDELLQRTRAQPGVRSAGIASITPLSAGRQMQGVYFERTELQELDPESDRYSAHYQVASDGFLETLEIPLLAGRRFDESDRNPSARTALVNETVAQEIRNLGFEPLGLRFDLGEQGLAPGTFEIVGVVGSIQQSRLQDAPVRRIYFPFHQTPRAQMRLFVQNELQTSLLPVLRDIVGQIDPQLPVLASFRMDELRQRALAEPRFYAQMIGAFAGICWLLALLGLYSSLGALVANRRREVGLRLALGATEQRILRSILGRGLMLVLVGTAIGLLLSLFATQAMTSFLFGVEHQDATVYLTVGVVALAAGLLASLVPGRRAMKVEPAIALADSSD